MTIDVEILTPRILPTKDLVDVSTGWTLPKTLSHPELLFAVLALTTKELHVTKLLTQLAEQVRVNHLANTPSLCGSR